MRTNTPTHRGLLSVAANVLLIAAGFGAHWLWGLFDRGAAADTEALDMPPGWIWFVYAAVFILTLAFSAAFPWGIADQR